MLLMVLFILSGLFSFISLMTNSPMKSVFSLLLSLLTFILEINFISMFWFHYFLLLLFSSGLFVILLYLSSLSQNYFTMNFVPILLLLLFTPGLTYVLDLNMLISFVLFNLIEWVVLMFLFLQLLIFSSVCLQSKSALRNL